MPSTISQKRRRRAIVRIILVGAILGFVYSSFSDGYQVLYPHINTIIIGILVGGLISYLEFYVFTKRGRRLKFLYLVGIRTALYIAFITVIVFLVLLVSRMIRQDMGFKEVLVSEEFQYYIFQQDFNVAIVYTVVFAFIINFSILMSRKIGKDVMWGMITGKYYKPKEIERVFMFLSVRHSDQIANKVLGLDFHRFIKDFFHDITEPILEHRGSIYEYVDDLVVVSWTPREGVPNANCIRTFYEAKKRIWENREHYYHTYGFVPKLAAGYHIGNVIQGELGEIKSPVVYFGDVMNTTSRIQGQCELLEQELILSAHLKNRLGLPPIYEPASCGEIKLKGKKEPMELYVIKEKPLTDLYAL
ncbi:adenylate/guanylate cyclase domain-containing protein [Flavobacteriaceae bacterium 3-367]|uniref:adenylate/guanylate cyclase domain-containing protein n=1 Tax=Eudoraea algarum TaxID=3417568 RepID=UPI0032870495